jgi:hypothetical protein
LYWVEVGKDQVEDGGRIDGINVNWNYNKMLLPNKIKAAEQQLDSRAH